MSNDRARLPVAGMTCPHCETTVRGALEAAGARDVHADFRHGEATFRLGEDVDPVALQAAVRDAGYRPGQV